MQWCYGNWIGSLVTGQQDATGLMYRRNRYYNPATGQFTQSDPIGIAGGLNTYGFASGDPTSYGDPLGLCPESLMREDGTCALTAEETQIARSAAEEMAAEAKAIWLDKLESGQIRTGRLAGHRIAETRWNEDGGATIVINDGLDDGSPLFWPSGGRPPRLNGVAWVGAHEIRHVIQNDGKTIMPRAALWTFSSLQGLLGDIFRLSLEGDANRYACRSVQDSLNPFCH